MFTDSLAHWLIPILQHGGFLHYAVIFSIIFLESIVFIGFFVPAETTLVLIGFFISEHILRLPMTDMILLTASAAVLGNIVSFLLGRFWYKPIAEGKWGKHFPAMLLKGEIFFGRHGGKSIFFGRYLNFFRSLTPFIAGCVKMKWAPFLSWTVFGAFAWVTTFLFLGFYTGEAWHHLFSRSRHLALWVGIGVALVAILFFLVRLRRQEKKGEENIQSLEKEADRAL